MQEASCSIVLYNSKKEDVTKVLECLIAETEIKVIYIIDNSPLASKLTITNSKIEYIHNTKNIGFGKAHNIAINKAIKSGFKNHFIVNPDIFFEKGVIAAMLKHLNANENIGMMMPKILNFDGSIQYLPKLAPSIFSIFLRRFNIHKSYLNDYELRKNETAIINIPHLSGCFTLLNLDVIQEMGAYDEKYFMYFEDWDLSRRVHQKYQTLFYPKVSVYHGYASEANKKIGLLLEFLKSMVKYFNTWGWFKTKEVRALNNKILTKLKEQQTN